MTEAPWQSVRRVGTDALSIASAEHGAADGWPVILSHGFPYDVISPYTRGFGPTRFISDDVMRSGQQAARGRDIAPGVRRRDQQGP